MASINVNSLKPITSKGPKNTLTPYKPSIYFDDKAEVAIIKDAIKVGYLVYPSKELLWEHYKKQVNQQKTIIIDDANKKRSRQKQELPPNNLGVIDLYLINYLNLTSLHVLEIGDICMCENLRILNLSNNYLVHIEPLMQCVHLIRLDLHNNQINMLPDAKYWAGLKKLKILYLHNNPIGKIENLRKLSTCNSLEILTLYDTPLSLKKNYRHHVVNIVISLKALDFHVISDEEIIEDAVFQNEFAAKTDAFFMNLHIEPSKFNNYNDELDATHSLLRRVNFIVSHFSPVHIIQKNIRAYIDKKFFNLTKKTLTWAAVTIQRWWRKMKNLEYVKPIIRRTSNTTTSKMPTDSLSNSVFTRTDGDEKGSTKRRSASTVGKNNIIIDLNKLQNRSSSVLETLNIEAQTNLTESKSRSEYTLAQTQTRQATMSPKAFKQRQISKLRKINMDKFFELGDLLTRLSQNYQANNTAGQGIDLLINFESEKALRYKLMKQEMESLTSEDEDDDDDEEPDYRLPIMSKRANLKNKNSYIVDLINEKKFYRRTIQELELESHKKMFEQRENIELVDKKPFKTNDQRFFQKIYGTMTLGCLRAVDKAYIDRNIAEKRQAKATEVQSFKDDRDTTRQNLNYFREERLKEVQKSRAKDKLHVAVSRRRQDLQKIQNKDHVQDYRGRSKDVTLERRKDILLAVDFNKQHLSVSKALQKHEYNIKKEESAKSNSLFVEKQRVNLAEQQEIVRKYLTQRNILRVTQAGREREIIDAQILQDANDRLLSAKRRVSKLKATQTAVTAVSRFHPSSKGGRSHVSAVIIPGENTLKSTLKSGHRTGDSIYLTAQDAVIPGVSNADASIRNGSSLSEYYVKRYDLPLTVNDQDK